MMAVCHAKYGHFRHPSLLQKYLQAYVHASNENKLGAQVERLGT